MKGGMYLGMVKMQKVKLQNWKHREIMDFNSVDEPDDWVCAKIPNDGRIKKDCVSKVFF